MDDRWFRLGDHGRYPTYQMTSNPYRSPTIEPSVANPRLDSRGQDSPIFRLSRLCNTVAFIVFAITIALMFFIVQHEYLGNTTSDFFVFTFMVLVFLSMASSFASLLVNIQCKRSLAMALTFIAFSSACSLAWIVISANIQRS